MILFALNYLLNHKFVLGKTCFQRDFKFFKNISFIVSFTKNNAVHEKKVVKKFNKYDT